MAGDLELVPDPGSLGARDHARDGALAQFGGDEVVVETVPIAALAVAGVGAGDPDDAHAERSELRVEPVDGGADRARDRHFRRRARLDECVLHVDNDERGLGRVERIEQVEPVAPSQHPVDDLFANLYVMHGG